jgi:Hypothetical glycosyl hydrolase family 15
MVMLQMRRSRVRQPRKRVLIEGAVAFALTPVLVAGPPITGAGAASNPLLPVGPGLIHRWVALNQVPPTSVTPDQAAAVAKNFDLAVIKSSEGAFVKPMKAANPDLTLLVYHNGSFVPKNKGSAYPEDWYAHDANHNKLQQTVFGNYLMDVSNPGWVGHVVQECKDFIAKTGADGCYTDMLMTAPLFGNYSSGGAPVNPATGQKWTFPDYQAAVEAIADAPYGRFQDPTPRTGWPTAGGGSIPTGARRRSPTMSTAHTPRSGSEIGR